jgi:hypothetical protein
MTMREAILISIRSRRFTTFQELTVDVPGFHGEIGMFSPERSSLIIWHAVSHDGIATLGGMIGYKSIRMHPAPNPSYKATDDLPPVPVCLSKEDFELESPFIRWFPVVFTETGEL